MSHVSSLSSFTYAGMAGLSIASLLGILKFWKYLFHSREDEARKDAELSSLRRSLSITAQDSKAKDEAMTILKKELDDAKSRLEEIEKMLDRSQSLNQVLGDQVKKLTEEAQRYREEVRELKSKHAQAVQSLKDRSSELERTNALLMPADKLSGEGITRMLHELNAEILRTAAAVAESFDFRVAEEPAQALEQEGWDDVSEVYASTMEILGPRMVEVLRSSDHHEDSTLIKIAFQAGMSAYAHWIISSWYYEDPEEEQLLREIYARVRETGESALTLPPYDVVIVVIEDQPISARWRALTRAYVQRMADHDPDLAIYFIDAFVNILKTVGIRTVSHESIAEKFADRISDVVKQAQELKKAVGEDILSCDFEVINTPQDSPFENATMDNALPDVAGQEDEPILCTIDLGLICVKKVAGKIGEWDEELILKPKVILPSSVEAMVAQSSS